MTSAEGTPIESKRSTLIEGFNSLIASASAVFPEPEAPVMITSFILRPPRRGSHRAPAHRPLRFPSAFPGVLDEQFGELPFQRFDLGPVAYQDVGVPRIVQRVV